MASGWTLDSLYKNFGQRFEGLDKIACNRPLETCYEVWLAINFKKNYSYRFQLEFR